MGQITTGIRSILSNPFIYDLAQNVFGIAKVRSDFVADFVRPQLGAKVLDIGCGTAEIIDCLPGVSYWGFDISPVYIEQARKKYGNKGHFFCKELTAEDLEYLPRFDIVIAVGVLHHLNDESAVALLDLVHSALKPGGRLVTIDACFEPGQNPLARLIISWDRGQNVRSREGYSELVSRVFPKPRVEVRHKTTGIPNTHCITEGTRTNNRGPLNDLSP
jgi:SAM-dependent methyltransferase